MNSVGAGASATRPFASQDPALRLRRSRTSAHLLLVLCLASCSRTSRQPDTNLFDIQRRYEKGPVNLILKISRQQITIADELELVLEVQAPEGQEVKFPTFSGKLGEFTINGSDTTPQRLAEGGRVVVSRSYQLEPFLAGDYQIPPITVQIGSASIETASETIKVVSVLQEGQKPELKEIGPPVELPGLSGWLFFSMGLAVAGLAIAGYLLWRRRRAAQKAEAAVPPHELALAELRKLMAENLISQGQAKLFYLRVSAILRHYIEGRFGLRAPERTTEEFLNDLQAAQTLLPRQKELLKRFLEHCDIVKFAEHQPTLEEVDDTLNTCAQFIAETRHQDASEIAASRQ